MLVTKCGTRHCRQHKVSPTANVGLRKILPCVFFIYIDTEVRYRNESIQIIDYPATEKEIYCVSAAYPVTSATR
jgi:hypothetical protein